ncbi:hypothetical protein ACDX78_06610 [Virgibacillus oceani]
MKTRSDLRIRRFLICDLRRISVVLRICTNSPLAGRRPDEKLGRDIDELSFEELRSPKIKEKSGKITFITATDGNHGAELHGLRGNLGRKLLYSCLKAPAGLDLKNCRMKGLTQKLPI